MRDLRRHLVSASTGVAGLVAIVYLVTHGLADSPLASPFAHIARPRGTGAFFVPGPQVQGDYGQILPLSVAGSATAALMIAAAGVITGGLCGWRSLSPAAPLAAGIPLFCLGLPWSWSYTAWDWLRPLTGAWGASSAASARVPLVLGGVLIAAALVPDRRTRRPATPGRKPWALAVLPGLIAIPVIGYLVQVTNLVTGYSYWLPAAAQPSSVAQRYVLPAALIAALASLAARRPTPRLAAVIAGLPLMVIGALGLLGTVAVTTRFGWSEIPSSSITSSAPFSPNNIFGASAGPSWQDGFMFLAIGGLPLLYGAMLVAAGLSRWFRNQPALADAHPGASTAGEVSTGGEVSTAGETSRAP